MTIGATRITRELKARRTALLIDYEERDLHQLRINIRRARALLGSHTDRDSVKLRGKLGNLASKTNAARDWDTFAIYAERVLSTNSWRLLQPSIEHQRAAAHARAVEMLQSDPWKATLKRWRKLVRHSGGDSFAENSMSGGNRGAVASVIQAKGRALERQDRRGWHKLRIAVKNLRYKLENTSLQGEEERGELKSLRKMCTRLQDALGDWHDTIIHRELLQEIAREHDSRDHAELDEAVKVLGVHLSASEADALSRVTSILEKHKSLLDRAAEAPATRG